MHVMRLLFLCLILHVVPLALLAQDTARSVRQTVFDTAGKPAAHAALFASYADGENIRLLQASADDAGRVVWTNLPAVKVIVWGNNVPGCCLPT